MTKAGLWDMDLINQSIFLSPMWKQILGYKDHEIENNIDTLKELIHPDDLENIERTGNHFIYGKLDVFESITRLKHKDGNWRWILIRGGVLNNKDGVPSRLIGTTIDISIEQEQAAELERFFTVNLDLNCNIKLAT